MVNFDHVAISAVFACTRNDACGNRNNFGACFRSKVDTAVEGCFTGKGVGATAIAGRDPTLGYRATGNKSVIFDFTGGK